jgi:hypothetical protein
MTTVEKAARIYQLEPCGGTFLSDLEAHLLHGFVFSRPDLFVMLRPVRLMFDADGRVCNKADIIDPWICHHDPDCWHVALFAGNAARAWEFLPWDMPWMSFERKNVLRFYRTESLRNHTLT